MGFTTVTFCAALLVLANAGPVYKLAATEESACSLTCSDTNKFDYQPGTVYEFSYDAKTTTKMNGASEDSAIINMNANVEIEPITKCDLVMRIKDASLRDSEDQQNSQAFKEAIMKHALKFSFQDGRIDHICSTEGESIWTLNIKRGILSAFQNSMDSFDRDQNLTETDVVGTCRSEYKIVSSSRRNERVEKTKNLLSCSDREGYRLAVQSIGYNVPSFVKSLPLMKSEYKCTQTLDLGSNILQSSTCSEEHVFRPFSYGKNGAMTSSEQTLTFTNKRRAGRPSRENFNQRSTLLFHHQDDIPSKQDKEDKIEAKLQELCQKAAEDIRPEVPEMVNQLIGHMRQVDRDVLSRVYKKINQRTICAPNADRIKQYFHDAIPMVGTEASVGMIQDLISKKHVTGSEAEMWLLSLSFVHHPTKEMVAAATPLLDERDVSGNTLLAVSSLASSYCNARSDCGKDSEITTLLRKLIDHTHDCNTQNGDARRIIFALRAIGNIGHSHETVSHLTRCFTRRDVREEIRIAAMDAFRRIPCDAMRSDLMGVFRDESEDSELRLNAYIALMKCPSRNVLSEVRQVLEKEKSNQVGSFVWSHLTNLMETSDPHMQDIRNIVQDEELKKEFNLDQRKFSRNYEGSFFLDSINMGAKVDSNVIFSQKSFIPRSANLNLTIDLFGHAINFLEFGGRVQGVEKILENFFGPAGTNTPALKSRVPINFDKSMDAFRASAYLRVFGNELRYWDDKSLNELQSSLKRLMYMQSLSFSKTMALLDSRMIIPTCVGLPLNLTISTTGSISLDAKASFQRPKYELNIDFRPSASIQVKGEMSVDAHVSRAGLKMVTVAHTSTGAKLDIRNNKFDLQIPQKKMEIFNLKTDFYIVHRNAEQRQRMIVDNVKKHEVCTGKFMKQVTGLSFCQILKFPNASHHKESPFFPFTGPVVYDLYMINEDVPNGYQIEGFTKQSPYSFYIDTPNSKVSRRIAVDTVMKNKKEAHITFKAPWKNIKIEGTVVNMLEMKKFTGTVSLNGRTEYALNAQLGVKNTKGLLSFTPKFDITIPQKRMEYEGIIEMKPMKSLLIDMSAKGFIANDINLKVSGEIVPKEIGLTTQFRIGKKEYYIASRLGRLVSKSGFKYTPSLKITTPNRDLVEFTSEILYESKKKMSFDFKLTKVFPKTIAMNALVLLNVGSKGAKHIVRILFKSPRGNFRIIGEVIKKKTGIISSRITGNYNFGKNYSDRLTLSSKIRDLSVKKSVRYMGNIALESYKHKSINFNLKGDFAKSNNHLETKFDLHHGNPKIKTNNLKFAFVLNRALKTYIHTYDYAMMIQHPEKKINYKVEANHVQSSKWPFKKFENKVMIQMALGKVVQTKLSYINSKVKSLPTYESEMALSYPGRDMKITNKLMQVNKNMYENNFSVQWQKGQEAMVKSMYTRTGKDIQNIENTLILPNKKEVKVTAMLQATSGAYKVKTQFAADEEVILRQPINYKAEGGVRYTFNARQMSSDVNAEIMWSPNKKISTNINFNYMRNGLFNSKLTFSTPFAAMRNFNSQVKYTWANRKYTSIMSVSWNNENELKHDFSFVYPDFQLSYDASALLNGKKSEVGLAMKYSDMSLNGNIKVHHDKTTIIDAILKHSTQRMNSESEILLEFDFLRTNGKMKITSKYDKRKGELMSNGEGKLNLPLQYLRQIGASYNFKHNEDLCSIDMSYSSSLRNYRNGKMSIEMKRNLPKMLKAKMDMTLNGNLMFNMEANYERQRDNIDMKVDITDANGKMATVSGNINFSGDRKTANIKIDSRYTEFSADGAFEYKGIQSADGELKVTADGKSVMMRANYKKERTTYKMSGTLGLPDGRSLKMEGSLDLQNIAASFKTMSPDFPELTEIDMSFFFNGNNRLFSSTASLKVMPYFDRTQVEMKLTKKLFSIEMKTQFETMKQAKATVMFDGDWIRSHKTKIVFQLNNEEMVDLDINYNFNSMSDFGISIAALTSHRRYKDFQFELKNKGPLSSMQSSLILKLANVLMLDAMFQNSRKASKASLDAQILDFDEWKSTFELKGNLDYMTANIITSIAKKEVNRIDAILKEYGRSINLKVSGPNPVNFDFNMKIDTEKITFDMSSTLTLNSRQVYDMSVMYKHLSKLQIKTSIPSYQDELIVTFSGNLKAFKAQTKFSHNNQIYELMLSNKEYYRQMKAILNTPYFQDTASFNFDGELSAMNIFAQVMHNKQKFELTFSNSGYYQQIDAKVDTPVFQVSLKGNPKKFNFESMIHFHKQIYEMKASNEEYFRQMNFLLNTPFMNWDFMFEGDLDNAKGTFSVLYGNRKYELTFSNKNFFQDCSLALTIPKHVLKVNGQLNIKKKATSGDFNIIYNKKKLSVSGTYKDFGRKKIIKGDLNTPYFKDTFTASVTGKPKKFNAAVKVVHKGDTYELTLSNKNFYEMIDLNIYAPGIEAKLDFEGEWKKFKSFASVKIVDDSYRFGLSNDNYVRNIHLEMASPQTGNIMFSYDLRGDLNNFNFTAQFSHRQNTYEMNVLRSMKTGEHRLTITGPQINIDGHFNGDLKSFSFNANVIFKKEKYEMMASTKNYFRDISGKLITPQFGEQSFSMKINGQLRDFNGFIEVKHNKELYRSEFSLANQEFRLSLPKMLEKLQVKLNGNWKNFEFIMQMMDYDGERIEFKASNKNFKEMKAHLAIPSIDNIDVLIKTNGDIRNGEATMKMAFGENVFENKVEMNFDGSQANFEIEPHYKILGRSGKAKLQIDLMFDDQSYKYELEADVEDVQFKSMASVKISSEISVLMTVNIPTFYASEMKLRLVSEGFRKTDMMLNLKSSRTGMIKIFYEHNGQMGNSFVTKGYIEQDGSRLTGYSLDSYFADDYSFDFKCDYDNFKNKIETQGDLKFQGRKTTATLSLTTPFQILKDFLISAETKMLRDSMKADVNVKLPNQEYSMNIEVNSSNLNALLNMNVDDRRKDRKYQFQTSYKNTDRSDDVSRSFNFKMVLPERTVSFDSRFENNQHSLLVSAQVMNEADKSQNFGVEFLFDKGNKNTFKCKLNTPRRNIELFGSFSAKGNQNTITGYVMLDADRSQQKIETKMDVFSYTNKKNIDLLLKFPNQKNGIRLKTFLTGTEGDSIFSGKTELSIDQDAAKTLIFDVNLIADHQKYMLNVSITHPDTNLLANMSTFVITDSDRFTTGMDLLFTTVNKEQHNIIIRGEILKMKREFNFKMQAPFKKIEVIGFMKTANRFVVSVKKTEAGKEDVEANFIVDPNVNSIHMDLNYDQENPSKVYRLDASAHVDKVMLKAYRMDGRIRRGTDTRIIAEIRPSHILYLSLRWNPNLLKDLNKFLYEKLRQFGSEVKTLGVEVSEIISEEFLRRFELTQKSLMADLRPVLKYFKMEHESLYRDVSRYMRNFNELYNKNNFYLKTVRTYLSRFWSDMWTEYKMMAYNLQVKFSEFSEFLSKKLDESTLYFEIIYGKANTELREKMANVYNSLKEYAVQVQDYYLSMFHAFLYTMKTDIIDFAQNVPGFLKVFIDDMKHNPFVTRMIVLWSEINDSITKKQSQLSQKMNDLTAAMSSVQATVSRQFDSIRYIPAMDALLEILNEAYQQLAWAYRYWNVKSNVNNIKGMITDMFFSKLNQLKTSFTELDMNTLVFAPRRGEIIVEVKYGAAIHVYNLVDSIMTMAKEMQLTFQKYQKMLPKGNTTIWDIYYMMKPSSQIPEWLPPFKAHASLFRGQHITTFDGRHFDYKGTCSYLMARDFVDGKFTVVANFDPDRSQRTIKSITVITAYNKEIEIFSDYKVKLQGEYTDLPIEMKDSFVLREGDQILLKSPRGYQVTADIRLGLYTLDISGWYFSKVAGMFGTYNYEPSDDMTMYNMARTDNIEEFATSWWTASSVCKSHRNFAPTHRIPDSQECHKYFVNNNSPFRNCFRQVKPDVYYHMCNTLRSSAYSTISDVCDVSAVYMGECRRKEVDLQMPQSCVSCMSIMGNHFFQKQGMVLKSSRVPAAADIILVVEERICNKMVGSRLPDIVKHIKTILEQKGLHDNRFGLIGFGGSRKEPNYIHTMDGEMISNSELMIRSLENLTFSVLPANVDVMKAVMRTSEYPFRVGVRKAVILVTCTGCHETDVTTWELAQMLEKFDITLHVLADHDFKTKGNMSAKTTYLYGADKSHAYSEGIVDAEMETNIVVPEDNCVQLGLESNGSYFDSKKLKKETANFSFMERFAERISESLMPTSCQRCDCVSNQRGLGQSICKSCSTTINNLPMIVKSHRK